MKEGSFNNNFGIFQCFRHSDLNNDRPSTAQFRDKLPWFLNALPSADCAKGGHGAYTSSVELEGLSNWIFIPLLVKIHLKKIQEIPACNHTQDFTLCLLCFDVIWQYVISIRCEFLTFV